MVLRLPPEMLDAMDARAKRERRSRNQWAQVVLENALASKVPAIPIVSYGELVEVDIDQLGKDGTT